MNKILLNNILLSSLFSITTTAMELSDGKNAEILARLTGENDVSYQDQLHKFAFAFFSDLSGMTPIKIPRSVELSKFEWFAGSLTSQVFSHELRQFLQSSYAADLNVKTSDVILQLVKDLEKTQWQANQVDIIRARNASLIKLAKTGDERYLSHDIEIEEREKIDLAAKTVRFIGGMNTGDKAIFLIGSVSHDTRLLVEKLDADRWEVTKYDSGSKKNLVTMYRVNQQELEYNFWHQIYATKFSNDQETINVPFSSWGWPTDLSDTLGVTQQANTCHASGLFLSLTDYILRKSDNDEEVGFHQYYNFVTSFSEYLLHDGKLKNEQLTEFGKAGKAALLLMISTYQHHNWNY